MAVYFEHKITTLVVGALLGAFVTSCADQDFDWEAAKSQNPEYTYRSNFEKLYGPIDPNQHWDFSICGSGNASMTRTTTDDSGDGSSEFSITKIANNYYLVDPTTLNWMKTNLVEGSNNTSKGATNFELTAQTASFSLIPIYQGHADLSWDLHMVCGGVDKAIWSKSEGFQITDDSSVTDETDWKGIGTGGNTMSAKNVRSQIIEISNIPLGEKIEFYLEITAKGGGWDKYEYGVVGDKMWSNRNMMAALACPKPGNITGENKTVMMIGCEDNNRMAEVRIDGTEKYYAASDWDMNDIVFLVVGEPAPQVVDIVSKRYMVEDLGSTDDIDFNDVVVDLEQRVVKEVVYSNGQATLEPVANGTSQTAIVRAMGGTLDFDFFIGGRKMFTKSKMTGITWSQMYNTIRESGIDYYWVANEVAVTGWIPSENNVMFRVWKNGQAQETDVLGNLIQVSTNDSGNVYNGINSNYTDIPFPSTGDVPYIIAFDVNRNWLDERHPISYEWINTGVESTTRTVAPYLPEE